MNNLSTSSVPKKYLEMTQEELEKRTYQAKEILGDDLLIMSHHYQKDEVVQFADEIGDSLQLAQVAAKHQGVKYIVFCGVHFMAETADMLTTDEQIVILPDLGAGCFMADMANHKQLTEAWDILQGYFKEELIPLTYINSTADVKAFVGQKNGVTVTSGNADKLVKWAFTQKERIFFLPDQHLGRNTAVNLGIPLENMAVWNPKTQKLEATGELSDIQVVLWDGYCSVHQQFNVQQIKYLRQKHPDIQVIVHPECCQEVVAAADQAGSTHKILQVIEQAEPGSTWAIGTDNNLVYRIIHDHPDKNILALNPISCPCLTMNRICLANLTWILEELVDGQVHNQITVDPKITKDALKPLDKMLELSR